MRNRIKKPMTARAEQLVVQELEKLREQGQDANAVLEQSIRNDWQDVYPLRDKSLKRENSPPSQDGFSDKERDARQAEARYAAEMAARKPEEK